MSHQLMTFQEFCHLTAGFTAGPMETMHNYIIHFRDATQVTSSTTPEALIETVESIERVAESEHMPTTFSEFIRSTPSISEQRLLPQVLFYRLHVLQYVQRRGADVQRPTHEEPRSRRSTSHSSPHQRQRQPQHQFQASRREPQHDPERARGQWVRERAPRNERSRHLREHESSRHQERPHHREPSRQREPSSQRGFWVRRRNPTSEGNSERHQHRHVHQHQREHQHRREHHHQRDQRENLQFRPSQDGDYFVQQANPSDAGRHGRHPGEYHSFEQPESGGRDYRAYERDQQSARENHERHNRYESHHDLEFHQDPNGGYYVEERAPAHPNAHSEGFMEEFAPRPTTPDFYAQYEDGLNPFGEPLTEAPIDTTRYVPPTRRVPTAAEMSEKCTICLEAPNANETVTVLPCVPQNHWFHHACIAGWIIQKRKQDCLLRCVQPVAS